MKQGITALAKKSVKKSGLKAYDYGSDKKLGQGSEGMKSSLAPSDISKSLGIGSLSKGISIGQDPLKKSPLMGEESEVEDIKEDISEMKSKTELTKKKSKALQKLIDQLK
jgi:hypothetical protein